MRYVFAGIILIHALIHLIGFAKAFGFGDHDMITGHISRPLGALWLMAAMLFLVMVPIFFSARPGWPILAWTAVALSQVVIFSLWDDARMGTLTNVIIGVVSLLAWTTHRFEAMYEADVRRNLERTVPLNPEVITDNDLAPLPLPVQKYLRYVGVVGRPRVVSARIVLHGQMRSRKVDWFNFTVEQYNFFDEPTRLFFMRARMFGVTVPGYHHYENGRASMEIRLFGLFPVVRASGGEMDKAETVTFFNEMCLMAPATLIDNRIGWEEIDNNSVKATFSTGKQRISAILYFDASGQLVDFVSDDRYDINERKQFRFSTPLGEYQLVDGQMRLTYGEGVWHYPEGMFVYGKFTIDLVEYPARSTR